MKIIHYTDGYGGNLNYMTTCGKEIGSHSATESASVHPSKVNCKECLKTKEWKQDYEDYISIRNNDIKRRIYLESDVLHASELRNAKREVSSFCEDKKLSYVRRVFSDVLDYAWHDLEKTWEAVKKADEIYSDSSLMPLSGGSYMGAPVIFNTMCEKAIKENVKGKSVFILNKLKSVYWDMIKIDVMKKAFKQNKLFMYDDNYDLIQVDVSNITKK